MVCVGSSGSLASASSGAASRGGDMGDELSTMMAGVDCTSCFRSWARSELRRECEYMSPAGGGDLKRGESGVESTGPGLEPGLEGRGARIVSLDDDGVDAGVISGMLVAEWARWTTTAVGPGVVELARLDMRLGLASVLLLRERKPGRTVGLAVVETLR